MLPVGRIAVARRARSWPGWPRDERARAGHLLVRAGRRLVGLPLAQVIEVLDPGTAFPVPALRAGGARRRRDPRADPAARASRRAARRRAVSGRSARHGRPRRARRTTAVPGSRGRRVRAVRPGSARAARQPALPWAAAVARTEAGLVPLLDLAALGARYLGGLRRMTIAGDDIQLVSFRVGSQEFAFDILQVERILRHVAPAPLPKAPDFLEGVVPYEGGAVPVVDLRKRFELGCAHPGGDPPDGGGPGRAAGGRAGRRGPRGDAGRQHDDHRARARW